MLAEATEEAAARWGYAMGCSITVGEGGVPVELVTRIQRPDGSDAPGATAEDRSYVHISARAGEAQRRRSLLHELGHLLGADGHCTEGDGVLSEAQPRRDVIDSAGLSLVCASRVCPAFRPEEP